MKRETLVNTYEVDYICDECGKGKMYPTGSLKTVMPPIYTHVCSNRECMANADLDREYPYIKHVKLY